MFSAEKSFGPWQKFSNLETSFKKIEFFVGLGGRLLLEMRLQLEILRYM